MTARHTLPGLTGWRVPAMLLVVMFHTVDNLVGARLWPLPGAGPFVANASVALTLFFFLSGYLLTLGWQPASSTRDFFVRRFARIYPVYLLAWVLAVLVSWIRYDDLPGLPVALATLTLTQSLIPSETYYFGVDMVFWSLSCEAVFYAALPWLLRWSWTLSTRTLWLLLAGCWAWLAGVPVAVYAVGGDGGVRVLTQLPYYRGAEFFAGVLACLLVRRGWRCPVSEQRAVLLGAGAFAACSLVLKLGATGANVNSARAGAVVLMFPFVALCIVATAVDNTAGYRGLLEGKWMQRLGDWTYPAYLLHIPLLLLCYDPPFHRTSSVVGGAVQLALYLAAVVALSALLNERFVVPVERSIKRRWLSSRALAPSGELAAGDR